MLNTKKLQPVKKHCINIHQQQMTDRMTGDLAGQVQSGGRSVFVSRQAVPIRVGGWCEFGTTELLILALNR
ncbi:hypothetical protein J6590_015476 [Homalodisca vitripennis]|nr:hypothetical protein J6590_015476 [Homalodisca vitripennis]